MIDNFSSEVLTCIVGVAKSYDSSILSLYRNVRQIIGMANNGY